MEAMGDNSIRILRSIVDRIERLESDRASIADEIKGIYQEAKSNAFDVSVIRLLIRERKKAANDREYEWGMLDTYRAALGDYASTPLGQAMEPADGC